MTRRDILTLMTRPLPESLPKTSEKGLEQYSGEWNMEMASHLLSRTIFGPTYQQIKDVTQMGLANAIGQLFEIETAVDPPINYYFQNDPNVPIGQTWVDAPYSQVQGLAGSRRRSLHGWTIGLLMNQGLTIREKMVLFWHNHYVISNIPDPRFVYYYSKLLRDHATGNFRDLTKKMTIDPAMLRYLNGNQNTKQAPNENYARELLELFTIGKGELAGEGDYTTFTEQDVREIARALTGWRDLGYNGTRSGQIGVQFIRNRHDTEAKQLSHRFGNQVIANNFDREYEDVVNIIFQQNEVARFISRKLYRWFVYYTIDEIVEKNVIGPMSEIILQDDYHIERALRTLLSSAHFFDSTYIGAMIKNPYDFLVGVANQLEFEDPPIPAVQYEFWFSLFARSEAMQMVYYYAPSVAGWKPYYQGPGYYQIWINASTLPVRMSFTDGAVSQGIQIARRTYLPLDVLALVEKLDDPLNPNTLITELATLLFPQGISQNQHDFLKEALIPGLPDYEWTVEYTDYLAEPQNELLKKALESKLRNLLMTMLAMPEFYLA